MKIVTISIVCISAVCLGQAPQWITYNNANSGLPDDFVPSIAVDGNNHKWIGTVYGGVAKFDGMIWTTYTYSNSGIGIQNIECITVDENDNKWFGSGWFELISQFDNNNWIVYDSASTGNVIGKDCDRTFDILNANGKIYVGTFGDGLKEFDGNTWKSLTTDPYSNFIYDLEKDANGNVWIAHSGKGISKYDGNTFTNFSATSTPLPSDDITSIAFESNGTMWATSRYDGLVKYDGTTWTVYTTINSSLPSNSFNTVKIDANNVKWLATGNGSTNWGSGLVKFVSPSNVSVYTTRNSGIPSNDVISIAIDKYNNKWIGTQRSGVGVFNEVGIASISSEPHITDVVCYPNPFVHESTVVSEQLKQFEIELADVLGQIVQTAIGYNGKVIIKRGNLASGVYQYAVVTKGKVVWRGKIIAE